MNRIWRIALVTTSAASVLSVPLLGQPAQRPAAEDATVTVYQAGGHVTAPVLLPTDFSKPIENTCTGSYSGEPDLSMIVDAQGAPRNIMFVHPLGNALDKLALMIAMADRFKPGKKDGTPVAVARTVKVKLEGCALAESNSSSVPVEMLRLRKPPEQIFGKLKHAPTMAILALTPSQADRSKHYQVGGAISAPVLLKAPEAKYTDEARRAGYDGICLISVIVDRQGMPQNLRVVRPANYGLNAKALEAVRRYRFKPAMRNGEPIPVIVTIEVNFQLLRR